MILLKKSGEEAKRTSEGAYRSPFKVTGKGEGGGRILNEVEWFGFNHTYFLND